MDEYSLKLQETFLNYLESIDKPNILEFGVRHGISTKMFIDICERKDGFLNSVDVDNYSKKFLSKKWKFIHGRDDNFQLVEKFISTTVETRRNEGMLETLILKQENSLVLCQHSRAGECTRRGLTLTISQC